MKRKQEEQYVEIKKSFNYKKMISDIEHHLDNNDLNKAKELKEKFPIEFKEVLKHYKGSKEHFHILYKNEITNKLEKEVITLDKNFKEILLKKIPCNSLLSATLIYAIMLIDIDSKKGLSFSEIIDISIIGYPSVALLIYAILSLLFISGYKATKKRLKEIKLIENKCNQ